MLVEDIGTAIQSSEDVSSLLIQMPKSLTRKKKTAVDAIRNVAEGKFS